ncbi:PspC domain-containing protein [Marinomonas balearica]|uniref:Phage shock protein C (PspC) family protein n=1 Tax=Marinomonas balearica TaxID=491947 RepID=A0A4R6M391_9GAMM|nr:PspC domain-containing protein [Marinomonas balearica]TDO95748.1 phage shock protein C (PspC) family protein [Marinomonas balearica]
MKYKYQGDFKQKKKQGWALNLYRNTQKGYIGGVCAGLADHFDIDTWVVRLAVFGGFLFLGGFTVMAYIGLWVFLDPKPDYEDIEYEYDERHHTYRPKKMFKYAESASARLHKAKEKLNTIAASVTNMERHVTSRKFDLNRQFSDLKDD